jgi:hypothetical protein
MQEAIAESSVGGAVVTVISGKKISYTLFLGCAQVEVHL